MDQTLRIPAVVAATGLSRSTIWRKVRKGDFPPPIQLSDNSIGWPESLIKEWREKCVRRTYSTLASETPDAKLAKTVSD
jgi:prophage regulatory protein